MKKLTTSVLAVVLTSSFAMVNAQVDTTKTQDIEGVVVTALGIKREKKSLGYASQEVKADALTEGTTNTGNVASQFAGKVAGLQVQTNNNFGGSSNLLIRGYKTLGGGSPLIVIDGSPVNNNTLSGVFDYGNFLSDINQEDIASINVLKGAAASALYGERGIDGVIVITTKSGKGKDDGSWGVTLSSSIQTGFIDRSTFPKYQKKYGAGYDPAFYTGSGAGGYDNVNFPEDASWGPAFDPNLLVYHWDSYDPTSPNYGKARPWVAAANGPAEFFETAVDYVNSISLEKGDNKTNFNLTYDNTISSGIMPASELRKNTLSLKLNHYLTDKLSASVYSTLTIQDTEGRNVTGYSDNVATGFREWWQTNVDLNDLRNAYDRNIKIPSEANNYGNVTWNRVSGSDGHPIFWNNPYFAAYQNAPVDTRTRSFSYAQLKYEFNKNWSITTKMSYDMLTTLLEQKLAIGSLTQVFGAAGNNASSGYSRQNYDTNEANFDLFANYKFDITDKINMSGVIGGNVRRNGLESIYASTEGGLQVPGIYSLGNSVNPVVAPAETSWSYVTSSAYATASFDFDQLFYLDGTYRVDKNSNLKKGNNVYGYFSVAGSLIMSKFIDAPWLNFWKVRGNYAEVGKSTDPYNLASTYTSSGIFNAAGGPVGIWLNPLSLAEPNLKPQRSKEYEVGTEASFLNNRITLDLALYKTQTFNQIISLPISSGSGYTAKRINAGEIENKGIEVSLGLVPLKSENFAWNIDVNWAKNENKVVDLYHDETNDITNLLIGSYQGGVSLNAREGEAFGTLVGSDYVWLDGQPVINPNTGFYLNEGNKVIGNINPDWTGGVRNSFRYKNLSLSFLIDVRKGGQIFSTDMYYGLATGLYEETAVGNVREEGVVWPGVNPDGSVNTTNTVNPEAFGSLDGYARMPASRFVYDQSFVKLREASIGYSLPKSLIAGTFLQEAKISIVGRNLWIIHKNMPYADPEASTGGGLRGVGNSIGVLPTTRTIGVNFTAKF